MQLFMTRLRRLGSFQLLQSVHEKQFANIPFRKSSRSDYSNEMRRRWIVSATGTDGTNYNSNNLMIQ